MNTSKYLYSKTMKFIHLGFRNTKRKNTKRIRVFLEKNNSKNKDKKKLMN